MPYFYINIKFNLVVYDFPSHILVPYDRIHKFYWALYLYPSSVRSVENSLRFDRVCLHLPVPEKINVIYDLQINIR